MLQTKGRARYNMLSQVEEMKSKMTDRSQKLKYSGSGSLPIFLLKSYDGSVFKSIGNSRNLFLFSVWLNLSG